MKGEKEEEEKSNEEDLCVHFKTWRKLKVLENWKPTYGHRGDEALQMSVGSKVF